MSVSASTSVSRDVLAPTIVIGPSAVLLVVTTPPPTPLRSDAAPQAWMSTASFLGRLARSLSPSVVFVIAAFFVSAVVFILARGWRRAGVGWLYYAHFQWPCIINLIAHSQSNCRLELFSWLSVRPAMAAFVFSNVPSPTAPSFIWLCMHWKPKKLPVPLLPLPFSFSHCHRRICRLGNPLKAPTLLYL